MSGERQFIDIAKNKIKGLTTSNYMTSPNIWMKVNQVMTRDVATIGPNETVAKAAVTMSEKNISKDFWEDALHFWQTHRL